MIWVVDHGGATTVRFKIPSTGKIFTGTVERLTKLDVARVALARCDGRLVEGLLKPAHIYTTAINRE